MRGIVGYRAARGPEGEDPLDALIALLFIAVGIVGAVAFAVLVRRLG